MIYHDRTQYELAPQLWQRDREIFNAGETERLAALEKKDRRTWVF
jgi:hypothetical protein